jgi:hypothetical protein
LGNAISLACTAWSSPTPVDASGLLQSVSCEVAFCAAVDDVGHGFVYQYGSWSSAATLPTGHVLVLPKRGMLGGWLRRNGGELPTGRVGVTADPWW